MDNIITIKVMVLTVIGGIGSLIASAYGGFDVGLKILIGLMCADYITGLIVAGIFKNSEKTENGGLESWAGWKGLCRKGVTLLIVLVAHWLDITAGTNVIRDAVIIGYTANEALSIIENAGLMGVPFSPKLMDAIEALQGKSKD